MKKPERNSPCPCGSGIKYKKCCLNKNNIYTPDFTSDDFLPKKIVFDYGKVRLSSSFFKKYKIEEFSSFNFLETSLFDNFYDAVEEYAIEAKIKDRSIEESNKIKSTNNLDELINIMLSGIDPLNHKLFIDKILKHSDLAIPKIVNLLNDNSSDDILEFATKIIVFSKIDCSENLFALISQNRKAYVISLLCYIIGRMKNKNFSQLLWDYFHYFKENFRTLTYKDGPLLGLFYIYND